jgi:hypothetical protein
VAAVEVILAALDADPEQVKHLTAWHWLMDALHDLPQVHVA